MAEAAGLEAARIVRIEAGRVDDERAAVADCPGRGTRGSRNLQHVYVSAVVIGVDVEVQQIVVGPPIAPAHVHGRRIHVVVEYRGGRRNRHAVQVVEHRMQDTRFDFVPISRAESRLPDAREIRVAGVLPLGAVAVLVVVVVAERAAEQDVQIGGWPACDEMRGRGAESVRTDFVVAEHAPLLMRSDDVLDVPCAELDHAADGATAVDVRCRATHHVDAADHRRIDIELAVGVMARALEILARAVDQHGDTAEILQASDIDCGRGVVAALLEIHAGNSEKEVGCSVGLQLLNLIGAHRAHRRERIDREFLRFGRDDRDYVEKNRLRRSRRSGSNCK